MSDSMHFAEELSAGGRLAVRSSVDKAELPVPQRILLVLRD